MNRKYFAAIALTAVFLLSSGGLLFANASAYSYHPNQHQTDNQSYQPLNLSFGGMIASAGNQTYHIHQSGPAYSTTFTFGNFLDTLQATHLDYDLKASVQGLTASGNAHFRLSGVLSGGSERLMVSGDAEIVGMTPALCLPSYTAPMSCPSTDTSAVPAFFNGLGTLQIYATPLNGAGHGELEQAQTMQDVAMHFESAYLNPFGAHIVFGAADPTSMFTLLVVTNYTQATIDWKNVVVLGPVGGTLGLTPVMGDFTQVTNEHENLMTGFAHDRGVMTFSNVMNMSATPAQPLTSLDVSGHFSGVSLIPTSESYPCLTKAGINPLCTNTDCSSTIGLPGLGVCTNTGFESFGTFNLRGDESFVTGAYQATWGSPAFATMASATGFQTSH